MHGVFQIEYLCMKLKNNERHFATFDFEDLCGDKSASPSLVILYQQIFV